MGAPLQRQREQAGDNVAIAGDAGKRFFVKCAQAPISSCARGFFSLTAVWDFRVRTRDARLTGGGRWYGIPANSSATSPRRCDPIPGIPSTSRMRRVRQANRREAGASASRPDDSENQSPAGQSAGRRRDRVERQALVSRPISSVPMAAMSNRPAVAPNTAGRP